MAQAAPVRDRSYDADLAYGGPLDDGWSPPPGRRSRPPSTDRSELRHRSPALFIVVAAVAIALIGAVVYLVRPDFRGNVSVAAGPTASTSAGSALSGEDTPGRPDPSPADTAPPVDPGQSTNVAADAQVSADSTAPDNVDSAKQTTSYQPANVADGDFTTAWRTPGDASGQSLNFTFSEPVTLTRVGMTNGYTKRDPISAADRYQEERRILSVTWSFDDGSQYRESFADNDWNIQSIDVPAVTTTSVRITITSTTGPGDPTHDFTAMSEVDLEGR